MRRRMLASICGVAKWKNPYITDGLVAMWDGEWNAGGGVHSSNPEVWKDLAGDADMYRVGDGNYIWNANNIDLMKGISYANRNKAFGNSEVLQMEAVFMYHKYGTGYENNKLFNLGAYYRLGSYDMHTRCVIYRCDAKVCTLCASLGSGISTYGFNIQKNKTYSASGSFKSDGPGIGIFANGIRRGIVSSYGAAGSNFLECMADGFADNTGLLGRIFCVRAYNRVLSDEEVLANYAVDKARFGLE